jgi:type IV pilus assembly protein PilW
MNKPLSIPGRRARSAGFSLVELMVALVLGMLLLVGLATLFANTSVARGEIDKAGRQIENGRFALQTLSDDVRDAGYYGPLNEAPGVPGGVPNPCLFNATDLGIPLQGYVDNTGLACLQGAAVGYKAGTGILVVRRASTALPAPGFAAGEYNIQVSGCAGDPAPYTVSTAASALTLHANSASAPGCKPLTSAPVADIAPLYVRIYYVSTCSDTDCSAAGADSVPTLKRIDVKPAGASTPVPVVDGIENIQFDYGLDGVLVDGAPESYTDTATPPTTPADWGNVMAVRIYVLSRNIDPTGTYTDAKTYALGTVSVTPTGADLKFKRHAYSELVRLNNPAGRRE